MSKTEPQIVIVGGGVIGVCCAYFLAKRGARVTLLERDEIGKAASYGNAGAITPGHGPINKPGRVKQALKSFFDPLSALYVAPRLDPALARWLGQFIRKCTASHLEYCMQVMGPLGHASRQLFDELIQHERIECHYRCEGYHEVYLTRQGLKSAEEEAELARRQGFHPEFLSASALRKCEPVFNDQVAGAVLYPEAATVNPHRFVIELADRGRRHGVVFQEGTEVRSVVTSAGSTKGVETVEGEIIEADAIVLAMGAYSVPLVQQLGLRLPLQAGKGYHCDIDLGIGRMPLLRRAAMLGEVSVFCTPMDGFLRFAGTLEFSGVNHDLRRARLDQLTNAAKRYMNGVEGKVSLSEWCGLRPCLPDGLPVVGPMSGYRGLFIATGHAMLGLTLGPVTGKLVAEYVLDGAPSIAIDPLGLERFQGA